jgi:glycerol-3-phosphate dehydrogenase (NAD(P)+)
VKIAVLGAGAWGTALAKLLREEASHRITLWAHEPARLEEIAQKGTNERYLPGIPLAGCLLEPSLSAAITEAECVVVAVPSKAFREVTSALGNYRGLVVSVTKGIEYDTGLTMSGVLGQTAPRAKVAALSGPTLALEVAKGIPSAIVAASDDAAAAQAVQSLFHRPAFRVYTSADLPGVELGGALKNVVVTRGIVEMRRLGVARGAQPETFSGLSGLGDLTVTCYSRLSRNRGFGERLGRGENVKKILDTSITVAEGYPTARSAYRLAQQLKVSTPIIDEVYAVLYEGKNVAKALLDLTNRESKAET